MTEPGSNTILLAEDDEIVRESLRLLLEANGFTLLEARDGAEALRIFRTYEGTIDLLITDLAMPKMNGRELVERVKSFHPDLPVMYISGKTSSPLMKQVILNEGSHFLSKPLSYKNLVHKVREMLEGRAAPLAVTHISDQLTRYAKGIGVAVKLEAVQAGVRVLVPASSAPINDAVLTSYIEEEMGLQFVEDQAAAPPAWRRLGIIAENQKPHPR
jgi:DNA-binding NtrC family response regulator